MKILHTADWHLADRLGRIDRTEDIRRAVERIGQICQEEQVDVLLIAGDLFSDLARPNALQETIAHLGQVFAGFLSDGGTIVALTGNHDNETFCKTLRGAFQLAAPRRSQSGDLLPSGRLHLATGPTFFRLADRAGQQVQFASLPYPTGDRYLDEPHQRFASIEERHLALRDACLNRLQQIQQQLDPRLPSVLGAHLYIGGTALRGLFRLSEEDDLLFSGESLSAGWSYVALGHIHQPQEVSGMPHVRYSGSIERLDLGEREDEKSVTLLEIGRQGLQGEPTPIPLDATPFYDVKITDPQTQLPQLAGQYPHAQTALTRIELTYRPGEDNLPEILAELDHLFPRCYSLTQKVAQQETGLPNGAESIELGQPLEVVRNYLEQTLSEDDQDRDALINLARELLEETA